MSRRRQAVKRPLLEDPKFYSTLVSRLVSTVMERGQKSLAQRIVYSAFDQIAEKNPNGNPLWGAVAAEIKDAYQCQGNAIRKRDEVHKMAQANKAFAHFRW